MFIFIIFYCFLWKMFILHSLDNIIWIIIRYLNRYLLFFFKSFFLEFEKNSKKKSIFFYNFFLILIYSKNFFLF